MEQYTESQYDDDLTVGMDEYDDFVQTDDVDLFEFYGEEESSISRLKTIVLSIDWEITDENLTDFNDELITLKGEVSADKVNLVYIQALEKIGKYIFKEKSNSNHNAIKLLQSFFYTLEKNLTTDLVSEEEKKQILVEDVKKFEKLKGQIGKSQSVEPKEETPAQVVVEESSSPAVPVADELPSALSDTDEDESLDVDDSENPILPLKAIILGMDWEITDKELSSLGVEVKRLEGIYSDSRPKLIFLQGIDALGAYIKTKRSNAHADVFKLLHSFSDNLEKIATGSFTYEEEKEILLPEVEKFNIFKEMIADTIDGQESDEPEYDDEKYGDVAPAFADVDDEEGGFREEDEAAAIGLQESSESVDNRLDSFFGDEPEPEAELKVEAESVSQKDADVEIGAFFDDEADATIESDHEAALQGVDVETEADDESDEEPLPFSPDGELAPALMGDDEESGFNLDDEGDSWQDTSEASEVFEKLNGFFGQDDEELGEQQDAQAALQGVDVETEADDDSDEEPLPFSDSGEVAPALSDEEFGEEEVSVDGDEADAIGASLDDMFGEDSPTGEPAPAFADFDESPTLDDEPAPAFADIEDSPALDDEPAPAFADIEESPALDDEPIPAFADIEDSPTFADESEIEAEAEAEDLFGDDDITPALAEDDGESDITGDMDDKLDSFFGEESAADITEQEETFSLDDGSGDLDALQDAAEEMDAFSFSDEQIADEAESAPVEDEEEEVVFQLADDDDQEPLSSEGDEAIFESQSLTEEEPSEQDDFGESETFDFAPEEEEIVVLDDISPDETQLADDSVESAIEDDEEDLEEYFKQTGLGADADKELLGDLRIGVSSIGVELEDGIIQSLLTEIREISQSWDDNPVGKTLLQLMSTVIQHIDQYRYEASSDAHGMLLSTFDKIEIVERGEISDLEAQELLLAETSKVLQWQQNMLDRQAVKKGDTLTFMDPVRSDAGGEQKLGEFVFTEDDVVTDEISEPSDEFVVFGSENIVEDEDEIIEEVEADDELVQEMFEEETVAQGEQLALDERQDGGEIAVVIREELKALKQSLQEEIESLRKELGK